MSTGLPINTTDIWNHGTATQYDFGPTGRGNNLIVYDPNIADFKVVTVNVADIITTDVSNCFINGISGQTVPNSLPYIVSVELTTAGALRMQHSPLTHVSQPCGYTRADVQSGMMTAPGLVTPQKWTVVGMLYRHPTHGIQGQFNSEYLIGRHDPWTTQLYAHPAASGTMNGGSITNTIPGDSQWHAIGDSLDFVTWADRLPTSPVIGAFTVFGSQIGQSIQIALGRTLAEATANPSACRCNATGVPHNLSVMCPISSAQPDGYVSLQAYARCDGGNGQYMQIGYAYNSTLGLGIWF